jgi:hypothetical protein
MLINRYPVRVTCLFSFICPVGLLLHPVLLVLLAAFPVGDARGLPLKVGMSGELLTQKGRVTVPSSGSVEVFYPGSYVNPPALTWKTDGADYFHVSDQTKTGFKVKSNLGQAYDFQVSGSSLVGRGREPAEGNLDRDDEAAGHSRPDAGGQQHRHEQLLPPRRRFRLRGDHRRGRWRGRWIRGGGSGFRLVGRADRQRVGDASRHGGFSVGG